MFNKGRAGADGRGWKVLGSIAPKTPPRELKLPRLGGGPGARSAAAARSLPEGNARGR